ncbi:MAG: NAD(P)-dependent glycerol-3-phosphate dehydrogenase [Saprospiraceae bacterium]|nr:NAD(P)-dependent glycerol-3-phosphate dehydrogenase [Saprospiraceae bacterium]
MQSNQPVGIVGAGSFGTAIANLLSYNTEVLLFSRQAALVDKINQQHTHFDLQLSERVRATNDIEELAQKCKLIFPIVPSVNFREMVRSIAPYLRPNHILIHGTKGFDVHGTEEGDLQSTRIKREHVYTMSEVIQELSTVVRVGCLSGPNLAREIMDGQPTATVIASKFDEVISLGKKVLSSKHFHVFGNYDLLGAELAGALKNMIAIGSGLLKGKGLGKNIQAMLITRGWTEMIYFGKAMGATSKAFFGTAGIGDLVATATSKNSRNFTFGYRLGQGEKVEDIKKTMPELAEGVRTLQIAKHLAQEYNLKVPITEMLYNLVFHDYDFDRVIDFLMTYPYDVDVDFL